MVVKSAFISLRRIAFSAYNSIRLLEVNEIVPSADNPKNLSALRAHSIRSDAFFFVVFLKSIDYLRTLIALSIVELLLTGSTLPEVIDLRKPSNADSFSDFYGLSLALNAEIFAGNPPKLTLFGV